MAYKYRHRETYRGVKIDVRAHTSGDLIDKVQAKKRAIDSDIIDDTVNLSTFGFNYLKSAKMTSVSASWYSDLTYMWGTIIREIGDRPLRNIRPMHLQEYLNSLRLADGTIKKRYDLICQVFRHAYIHGATPTDYTLGLVRPHGSPTVNGRSITDEERVTLLNILDGHRGELFCKLMLYCGLRPSEVQALTWQDIDLANRTIKVNKSLKRDGTVGTLKTAASYRTVPIPDHLIALLQSNRSDGDVFSHNPKWRDRMWNNIRKTAGLDFALYDLRHTYCTDLEKMGVPISIASRFMGHSNINITAKIYTHASTEALEIGRNIINQVGNQVGKHSENSEISTNVPRLAVMRSGVRTPYAPPK